MDEQDFPRCFDTLQRIGESFRSSVYAFVLIYGALLLWTLNNYIFPAQQNRIGAMELQTARLASCLHLSDRVDLPACRDLLSHSAYHDAVADKEVPWSNDKALIAELQQLDMDMRKRGLGDQIARSASTADFQVPLVGIITDRSWLWLVSCTIGLFFYQILKDQLTNFCRLFEFIAVRVHDNPARRILLSTTQVITSSGITVDGRRSWTKRASMVVILALPLVIGLFQLYDYYWLLIANTGSHPTLVFTWPFRLVVNGDFWHEPEGSYGGPIALIVFAIELRIFWGITKLLTKLARMHDAILPERG
ncbi:MAG TPA: hypothetical protein VHS58_14655 [Acetobacteraceae bacterium]|jgi:hypothetical protein|nr:hypothetical protein [Acetobacteraceae bacterium]